MQQTFLIIGVGNSLRTDDGIGSYICKKISALGYKNVDTKIVHQTGTELIEDFLNYNYIIFADASINEQLPTITRACTNNLSAATQSHHTSVHMLYKLAIQLHNRDFNIFMCAVPASHFEHGETLSTEGKKMADLAIEKILAFIKTH